MRAKGKKLADAAGRLGSAKENYHTLLSYRNFPARQVFIRKIIVPRTTNQMANQISNRELNYGTG